MEDYAMNVRIKVADYLDYCRIRKELDEKTLKAYKIDLRQYFEFCDCDEPEKKEIETYINNIEKIFKLLRIYNKKEIFLTSLYETSFLNNTKVTEINNRLKQLCDTYQVHYIDITDILKNKEYIFNNTSFYFNYRGHRYISEEILKHL